MVQVVGSGPNETLLYHYTGIDGLKGILDTRTLWAKDIEQQVDTQELRQGVERLCERLGRGDIVDSLSLTTPGAMISVLQGWLRGHPPTYVACFCDNPDDPYQWTIRPPPYSIGFDVQELCATERPAEFRKYLCKVTYDSDTPEVEELLRQTAEGAMSGGGGAREMKWWGTQVPLLASYKHRSYEAEREWRLIAMASPGEPRPSGTAHVDLPLTDSIIKEVWVGPVAGAKTIAEETKVLLQRHGLRAEVRLSAIPFP